MSKIQSAMHKKQNVNFGLLCFIVSMLVIVASFLIFYGISHAESDENPSNATEDWTNPNSLPTNAGDYKLIVDVTFKETTPSFASNSWWIVPSGKTSLDLNGHTIKNVAPDWMPMGHSIIEVNTGASLRIYDSSSNDPEQQGSISGADAYVGGGFVIDGGNLVIEGGQIINNYVEDMGAGILARGSSTVTIKGGKISNNHVTNNQYSAIGGGIAVCDSSNLTIEGGTISGNTAKMGGGIALHGGDPNTHLELKNGTISSNAATYAGGGIYLGNGTANMQGGTITMNGAQYGAGINVDSTTSGYTERKGKLTLSGGTITYNSGEGILARNSITLRSSATPINISENNDNGAIQVYNNGKCNLVLLHDAYVNFDSNFAVPTNPIPIDCIKYVDGTYAKDDNRVVTNNFSTYCPSGTADNVLVNELNYGILVLSDNELKIEPHIHHWAGIKQETDTSISAWCDVEGCDYTESTPAKFLLNKEDTEFSGDQVGVNVIDQLSGNIDSFKHGEIYYYGVDPTIYGSNIPPTMPGKYYAQVVVRCTDPYLGDMKYVKSNEFSITGYADTISGTVYNADGTDTIEGATVYWRNLDDKSTDPQGRLYETTSASDGTYSLLVPGNRNGVLGVDYQSEGYLLDYHQLNTGTADMPNNNWYLYKGHQASVTGETPGHISFTANYYENGELVEGPITSPTIGNILICDGAKISVDENEVLHYVLDTELEDKKVTIKANHEEYYETYFWQIGDDTVLDIGDDPITISPDKDTYDIVARYMPLCKMSITSSSPVHDNFTYKYRYNEDQYTTGTIPSITDSTIYASTVVTVDENYNLVTTYSSPEGWDLKQFTLDSQTTANISSSHPEYSIIGWTYEGLLITEPITVQQGSHYNFAPVYNKKVNVTINSDEDFELKDYVNFDFTYQINEDDPLSWTAASYEEALYSGTTYTVDATNNQLHLQYAIGGTVPYSEDGVIVPHEIKGAKFVGWQCNEATLEPGQTYTMADTLDSYEFIAIYQVQEKPYINIDISQEALENYGFEYYENGELKGSGTNPDLSDKFYAGTIIKILGDERLSLSYTPAEEEFANDANETDSMEYILTANGKEGAVFQNWLLNNVAFTDTEGTNLESGENYVIGAAFSGYEPGPGPEPTPENINAAQTSDFNFMLIIMLTFVFAASAGIFFYRIRLNR